MTICPKDIYALKDHHNLPKQEYLVIAVSITITITGCYAVKQKPLSYHTTSFRQYIIDA
jgi:hypothetical protein